jgi:hypothetical protein
VNWSCRRWKHGKHPLASSWQARPSPLDCELERTGKSDRVGRRDWGGACFRCRRCQSWRNHFHRDPYEGHCRSSEDVICERGGQRRRDRCWQLPSGASRWPHRSDRPRHGLDSQWVAHQIGHPVIKAFNNILAKSLLEKGRSQGNEGADRHLGRRRSSASQGVSASPRRRCWLRPRRRWRSGQLLAAAPTTKGCNSLPFPFYGSRPNTVSSVCVPTYTFPFATTGTPNFTALPAALAAPMVVSLR